MSGSYQHLPALLRCHTFTSELLANQVIQRRLSIVALANRLRLSFRDHANALTRAKTSRKSSEHILDRALSGPTIPDETKMMMGIQLPELACRKFTN